MLSEWAPGVESERARPDGVACRTDARDIVKPVSARPRITVEERRARVGLRHALAAGTQVPTLADAATSVVVLHASDSPSVFLQARARMAASSPAAIEREMYEERTVLRVLAMRRTLFLVPVADVPMVHAAASRAVAETERKRTIALLTERRHRTGPGSAARGAGGGRAGRGARTRRGDDRRADGRWTRASARS